MMGMVLFIVTKSLFSPLDRYAVPVEDTPPKKPPGDAVSEEKKL
jgi:hypothetical protein